MNKSQRLLSFIVLLAALTAIFPVKARAETIHSFDVKITLAKDGTFNVAEKINYDFEGRLRHGIYRDIPLSRGVGDKFRNLKITPIQFLRDDKPENYSASYSGNIISFKIGKANETVTGTHAYTLIYKVENGISNFSDHDELYWNVTGNEWKFPIENASITVVPPSGVPIQKSTGYTGAYGSRDKYFKSYMSGSDLIAKTTVRLSPNEGFSIVAAFPANTFPKSMLSDQDMAGISSARNQTIFGIIFILILILNAVIPITIIIWYRKTHHKELNFGNPFVNFDIPKNKDGTRLSPAEAGTTDTARLDQNDIVGTIFDLAIRKYILIEQITDQSSFLGFDTSHKEYKIKKLDYPKGDSLLPHEQILIQRLFEAGNEVKIDDLRSDFYKTFEKLEEALFEELVRKGYYQKNPKTQNQLLVAVSIFCLFFFLFLPAIAFFILSRILNGRTSLGDEIDWRVDGLKLFLSKMSRNYKWQADQLAIVEQMIPYAIALGYVDKFMEQLKIIYPDYKPGWYTGNAPFYLMSSSLFHSLNSGLTTSDPSSSSGFGGGGFSGGGGGGGGGGSW